MSNSARRSIEPSDGFRPVSVGSPLGPVDLANEKHYSVIEIAKLWALSEKTVRKIFEREPGVIHWCTQERLHKRGYRRCGCLKRFFTAFIESCVEQAKAQPQRKDQ